MYPEVSKLFIAHDYRLMELSNFSCNFWHVPDYSKFLLSQKIEYNSGYYVEIFLNISVYSG